jgi:glycosyltransferase involved in cell wall biosynthesis
VRIKNVLKLKKGDIAYFQHEILPYFPPILEWYITKLRGVNIILDYDDAIFHNYDRNPYKIFKFLFSNKIPKVMGMSSCIITGSPYLTAFASKFSKNVIEIPTCIDFNKYNNVINENDFSTESLIIGWVGSKTTSINLLPIIPALKKFSEKYDMQLRLLGFDNSLAEKFEGINCKILSWSSETEVQDINSFDVGIMPLEDTLFNRGKCGFKLIQYMACGKATISSPLEANIKINRNHKNLHADSVAEWYTCFEKVLMEKANFKLIGKENSLIVSQEYSIQSNYIKYLNLFNQYLS